MERVGPPLQDRGLPFEDQRPARRFRLHQAVQGQQEQIRHRRPSRRSLNRNPDIQRGRQRRLHRRRHLGRFPFQGQDVADGSRAEGSDDLHVGGPQLRLRQDVRRDSLRPVSDFG